MGVISIIKKWTLPVAIATGAIVYLLFAFIPLLSPASAVFRADIRLPFAHLYVFNALRYVLQSRFPRLVPVQWHFWIGAFQVLFVLIAVGFILFFSCKATFDTYGVGVGVHYLSLCIGGSHRYAEVGWQH